MTPRPKTAGGETAGALLSFGLRGVYAGAVVVLPVVHGVLALALITAGAAGFQLVGTLVSWIRERRAMDALYDDVAIRLTDVDAMRPLPLPALDPEIAVARGIRARARVGATLTPSIYGDGAAFVALGIVLLVSELRTALLPTALGALLATPAYFLLSRAFRQAQEHAHDAWIALYMHLSSFLAERQELLASGGRARFLAELLTRVDADRRRAFVAAVLGAMLRRVPLGLAMVGALGFFAFAHVSVPVTPASAWLLACLLASANAVASAIAERSALSEDSRELDQLLALVPTPPHGGEAPGRCARIRVEAVSFEYVAGARVFAPVSFTAEHGSIIVLRGKNGSGKSTLMRLLAGLSAPTEGELFVDDVPLRQLELEKYRSRIAFVPQTTNVNARATVREILRDAGAQERSTIRALDAVGFDDPEQVLDTRLGTLSGGRKRRVQLARAIAMRPAILLLDEPEAGLDEPSTRRLAAHLRELAKSVVVVIATHQHAFEGHDVTLVTEA